MGVYVAHTPDRIGVMENGTKVAYLSWLLSDEMSAPGNPRVALEEEMFRVSVTLEARNRSFSGDDPIYVVLVPPPGETGIYRITRTAAPVSLAEGERNAWSFDVATLVGRIALDNLTDTERSQITNMTAHPEVFSFRAYAFTDGLDEIVSVASDPVITVRPASVRGGQYPDLPESYRILGIDSSILQVSETLNDAWRRGVSEDEVIAASSADLLVLGSLSKEDLKNLHAAQSPSAAVQAIESSPVDGIVSLLASVAGWFQASLHALLG